MNVTDPIADMLTRIRNGNTAGKDVVSMPSSKVLVEVARVIAEEGYIEGYAVEDTKPQKTLHVTLKYGARHARVIRGIKRISKPGLRRYAKSDALPMPLGGLGIAIISTSSGLLTQKECLDRGIGGEIVAFVW